MSVLYRFCPCHALFHFVVWCHRCPPVKFPACVIGLPSRIRVWSVSCVLNLQASLLDICTVAWLFELVVIGYCWTKGFWFSQNPITQQFVSDNPVVLTKMHINRHESVCHLQTRALCSIMKKSTEFTVTFSSLLLCILVGFSCLC